MNVISKEYAVNEEIQIYPSVRLIDVDGQQLGVQSTEEALRLARAKGSDLVLIAPHGSPPVARIMDYGKFRFEQSKKEKSQRKHQRQTVVKEVRLRPAIGENDLLTKAKAAQDFINEGNKVKLSVIFRGREMIHMNQGIDLVNRFFALLKNAVMEKLPEVESEKHLVAIIGPAKIKQKTEKKEG
ncbi:MAG TPA: translation initiation factor IF-3 [Thermodesulfobium narugense]|uniref:Translation initiation factor IF-3 n=1 Tax=Thermodesulfobium acidiphilum TaxID=1794699 RepID=A0A2R4VYM5_THEAF|nr:translation initiation factor IF-3 [Thermodesulfobium acidiphilum]AWB09659.1 bacterial translation initiation factor 3 (bIF-3) [Thermodesulfobium acidiphilum]PMP85529.1 MAG: translation initiation factor IF-3 [Thermodesulfobium narugense]HEM55271.1 translation initiation factor IF-3 [Thermodesulfobium narugense]